MFRIVKYTLLVIAPIVLMVVLYLSLHGLPEPLTRNIERQLQFSGMVLSLDKIKLGVFEGIIATRVCYHRKGDIGAPVFEAEKIVLQCDPLRWMKGGPGVTGAKIKNGIFRLMIGAGAEAAAAGPRVLMFDRLQAHVKWDQLPEMRVEELSAHLAGIKVTGRGILNIAAPAPGEPSPFPASSAPMPVPSDQAEGRISPLVLEVLQVCQAVRLKNPLNAEVVFWIDSTDVRKLVLHIKMDSRNTEVGPCSVEAWRARIGVRGMAAKGLLEIKNGNLQGVWVEKAACRFACDDQALTIEQLDAVVGRGPGKGPMSLSLKYAWMSTEFEGQWAAEMNLRALLPLLRQQYPSQAWILEAFQFAKSPPDVKTTFRGRCNPTFFLDLDSRTHAYDMAYYDVPLSEVQVSVAVALAGTNGVVVTLTPMAAVRPEGSGQGWVRVDLGAQAVSFDASSTLNPYAAAKMIDPFIDRLVRQFRFEGPVRATGWGTIGFADTRLDDMDLMIEARRAGWGMFLADTYALDLRLVGDHTEITDIRGTIYEGQFDARASVYMVPGGALMRYETEADVRDVDFNQVMEVLAGKPTELYEGKLSAHVDLEGAIGEGQGRSGRGTGWVKITDGRIFQIPLFGGLSDFLSRVIPGMSALLRQTDVKASFVIGDGKIHSDEILIEGDVLSLVGKGDYALDGTLDFTIQVKLLRKHTLAANVFRFVTNPVSKMLEFHLGGTVASPRWRPVNIPKEVFLIFD
ncbi:MAG: AsmA-like C-terminal region-containing protein [Verrucomicrobia bacterium]|nr:AsmA-like C-terminal region-containing protein [Verrucomicrobiota bacterium]MCG2681010.1 AsmA-like C-terminal region-containing protein [Kiritimatiellia bacterium]MBU4247790.1 AsmA-like C-terminal region-containing protein [Verrucomicrobiota bacterium]MBU4292078.1 AsmA-like C-terminal region-containing protein [Verrucomicrobiota bacterium]MBU4428916.1 AsmA-like C-terminal region-containing protein [Verrucomicrobiota bacterium]